MAANNNSQQKPTIIRNIIIVAVFAVANLCCGIIRDVILARAWGTGPSMDIFLGAQSIPDLCITAFSGSIYIVLIPLLVARNQDLTNALVNIILLVTIGITSGFVFFHEAVVALILPGFSPAARAEVGIILTILAPSILLTVIQNILNAILHCESDFFRPTAVKLGENLLVIVMTVTVIARYSIRGVALAIVGSQVLSTVWLWHTVRKKKGMVFTMRWSCGSDLSPLTNIFTLSLSTTLMRLFIVVDRSFASLLSTGAIASLNYSQHMVTVAHGVINLPIANVFYPALNRIIKSGNVVKLRSMIASATMLNFIVVVPVMAIFICRGEDIIRLLYQRGKFTAADTAAVNTILAGYMAGFIFYFLNSMTVRIYYAYQEYFEVLKLSVIFFMANFIFDFILIRYYQALGLALSSSAVMLVWFLMALRIFGRIGIGIRDMVDFQQIIMQVAATTLLSLVVFWTIKPFWPALVIFAIVYAGCNYRSARRIFVELRRAEL